MSVGAIVIVMLSTCCIAAAAEGQTVNEHQPTPGTVALLVQPKGVADLRMLDIALGDSDPIVRAVAARVTGLLGRQELAPALLGLLEREPNATAAAEQVRALLYLRGVEILPQAKAAATRLGAAVGARVAEWLARTDPTRLAATWPELLDNVREPDKLILASIAAMAVRQTPGALDSMAASVATSASGRAWHVFLERVPNVDAQVLKSGLASSDPNVREATIWFVVTDAKPTGTVPITDVRLALNASDQAARTDDTEWAAFGRELIERRFGKTNVADESDLITRQAIKVRSAGSTLAGVPELTTRERQALRSVNPDLPASPAIDTQLATAPAPVGTKPLDFRARTFPSIAPGVFDSLLSALHCKLPSRPAAFGAARISYQRDGRPKSIAIDTTTLTRACDPFVDYLARLTVAQPDQPILDDVSQWWIISMDKAVISCTDEDTSGFLDSAVAERVGGEIKVPHKIKDVKPQYPESMQLARISGIVVIQATITATGCVSNAEVVRSIQLPIDLAALQAVSAWRFDPTRVDGIPVPVKMTVTVNFILQ